METKEYIISLDSPNIELYCDITIPIDCKGVVIFAHGSGSGRHSPRNQYTAAVFQSSGFASLLIDLLTKEEAEIDEETAQYRFDIDLLADRLVKTIDWLKHFEPLRAVPIALYGGSTGAAAAMIAAAKKPQEVFSLISRGGRVDLAQDYVQQIKAPTLFIIGANDHTIRSLTPSIFAALSAKKETRIIPHAGHLFEEPGALKEVSLISCDWLERSLQHYRKSNEMEMSG
ncbi:MAG: dienelactone hydrolase family protein [Oligoflexus sp.]